MNDRERWNRVLHFEPVDHVPDVEFWYWEETISVWHEQGLPPEIDSPYGKADVYFGLTRREWWQGNNFFFPPLPETVLEETDEYRIVTDRFGGVCKLMKPFAQSTMPLFLDFPIWRPHDQPTPVGCPARRVSQFCHPQLRCRNQRNWWIPPAARSPWLQESHMASPPRGWQGETCPGHGRILSYA